MCFSCYIFCGLLKLPGPFLAADRRQNMQLSSKKLKGRFFQCYSRQISKQALPSVISQEIGSKSDRVDHAIQVLISAGMSTPALRLCAERGVDVSCAGHAEVAVPVVILGPQPLCRDGGCGCWRVPSSNPLFGGLLYLKKYYSGVEKHHVLRLLLLLLHSFNSCTKLND